MQLQFSHPSISDSEFVERIEQKKASFYRVAFGYTRNEDDALEVVQEAVCKAYTAKWRLRDPERFYPWFYRILTNTAPLSFLRRRPPQGLCRRRGTRSRLRTVRSGGQTPSG